MSIKIKDTNVLESLLQVPYDEKLIHLTQWIATRFSDVVFTCGFREGDKGVHGTIPCRGMDIRSWIYSDPQEVEDEINAHFIYDHERPEKKCAWWHGKGKNKHIHLKTHPNTKYLGG